MKEQHLKEFSLALITFLALMLYVELRMSHFNVKGRQYEQVGVMKYDNNGDILYVPVFKEKK